MYIRGVFFVRNIFRSEKQKQMETQTKLTSRILQVMELIRENSPELLANIDETPVSLPAADTTIDNSGFHAYYNVLLQILVGYTVNRADLVKPRKEL